VKRHYLHCTFLSQTIKFRLAWSSTTTPPYEHALLLLNKGQGEANEYLENLQRAASQQRSQPVPLITPFSASLPENLCISVFSFDGFARTWRMISQEKKGKQ